MNKERLQILEKKLQSLKYTNRLAWDDRDDYPEEMLRDEESLERKIEKLKKDEMEKTLTYDDQVKIKNYLTKIKSHLHSIEEDKREIYNIIDKINNILNDDRRQ